MLKQLDEEKLAGRDPTVSPTDVDPRDTYLRPINASRALSTMAAAAPMRMSPGGAGDGAIACTKVLHGATA